MPARPVSMRHSKPFEAAWQAPRKYVPLAEALHPTPMSKKASLATLPRQALPLLPIGPRILARGIVGGGEGLLVTRDAATITHHGTIDKSHNEDSMGMARIYPADPREPPIDVDAVADGVGGWPSGDLASRAFVEALFSHLQLAETTEDVMACPKAAMESCRSDLDARDLQGGTTATVVCSQAGRGAFFHTGDSPAMATWNGAGTVLPGMVMTRPHIDFVLGEDTHRAEHGRPRSHEPFWLQAIQEGADLVHALAERRPLYVEETPFDLSATGGLIAWGSDGGLGTNLGSGDLLAMMAPGRDSAAGAVLLVATELVDRIAAWEKAWSVRRSNRVIPTYPRTAFDGTVVCEAPVHPDNLTLGLRWVNPLSDLAGAASLHRALLKALRERFDDVPPDRVRANAHPERYRDAIYALRAVPPWPEEYVIPALHAMGLLT
ncbi:MAG: hypothetical protein HY543_07410 [Deltaproteobacteria bacterium]|nr:hypothetical protein [Deltaproteobacteria bacterium]